MKQTAVMKKWVARLMEQDRTEQEAIAELTEFNSELRATLLKLPNERGDGK